MKRFTTPICLMIFSAAALLASGRPEPQLVAADPTVAVEELNMSNPAVINIVETYPDENIYNAIGRNTVRSGQPEAIFTVFDELRRTYDPIIVNWEFVPLGQSSNASSGTAATVSAVGANPMVSQELMTYARNHIGLVDRYEILETYDPTMASIIIVVECGKSTSEITPKVSMTNYNFNYRLITPTDQIVIGRSSASIVKENYHDTAAMKIGEKILVDVWY